VALARRGRDFRGELADPRGMRFAAAGRDIVSFRALIRPSSFCLLLVFLLARPASPQLPSPLGPAPAAQAPAPSTDALGRSTPRGTVFGFLGAGRKGDHRVARHYLNTRLNDAAAETLAQQLFVVLDARLPAQLLRVSDEPEGSRADPLAPDEERIATIAGASGPIDITLERVRPGRNEEPIWLFSTKTLAAIPATYGVISNEGLPAFVPHFLVSHRIAGIRLAEWLAILIGLPLIYLITGVVNRVISPLVAWTGKRFFEGDGTVRNALPTPARLLILSVATQIWVANLPVSLLVRVMLANAASVTAIIALTWLIVLLAHQVERYTEQRVPPANFSATVSLLRVGTTLIDIVIVIAGVLVLLRHFGVDPTPILAGLGVGGIAVALAAQKTLENVIAGASLIFDQAVRLGDSLRVGTIEGTVEEIGLRSTRIRTNDRTLVSVPNSQIASVSLETLSARDKFWFHPVLPLTYETTSEQLHVVLDGIRQLLSGHPVVERGSVRVRLLRLGSFSQDVEVFAYVYARDWVHFLEIQEELLFKVTSIVQRAGTQIAFPTQRLYLDGVNAATSQLPISK
jgi:MscS family membrane protein